MSGDGPTFSPKNAEGAAVRIGLTVKGSTADEIWAGIIPPGEDSPASLRRTTDLLSQLARDA